MEVDEINDSSKPLISKPDFCVWVELSSPDFAL